MYIVQVRESVTSPNAPATIVPDSILDKIQNVVDQRQQVGARRVDGLREARPACRCRLPSVFSDSTFDRISRLLSGVRSSCDMLARNSDLYFEVSASCSAFSSSACLACSTSEFLLLHFGVLLQPAVGLFLPAPRSSSAALPAGSSAVPPTPGATGLPSPVFSPPPALSSSVSVWDCFEQLLGPHTRRDGVQHDADTFRQLIEERGESSVEPLERGQLDDGLDLAFEEDGHDDDVVRGRRGTETRS